MRCRNRRIWKKKISYDCRKRVADNRLRVKGKFVTKKQVCSLLGVEELEDNELKHLLEMKGSKSTE